MKKASVIICTHNGIANGIEACLKSILELNYPSEKLEVIVVNDASTDHTTECVNDYKSLSAQRDLEFKYLINSKNLQLYASKQRGVESTSDTSEIILVTDDDCEVDPQWSTQLTKHYEDDKIDSVGGFIGSKDCRTVLEKFAITQENNVLCNPTDARFFHGANCSYRKSALLEIGGFNPDTISGGDAEISFKLKQAGFKLKYEPEAIVYHQHRTSLKGLWKQFKKYGGGDYILLKKFGEARFRPEEMRDKFLGSIADIPMEIIKSPFVPDTRLSLATPFLNVYKSLAC